MYGDVNTGDGKELVKLKAASGIWTTGYDGADMYYSWECDVFRLKLRDTATKV